MKLTRPIEGAMLLLSVWGLGCFGQHADDGADNKNVPGPDAEATEFRSGTLVHSEQLSPTAKLEIWDQGEDGAAIAMRGRSDFDAALKARLPAVMKETGDLETVYRRLQPNATALPQAVRDFAQALARRPALAPDLQPAKVAAPSGDPDTVGGETEANSIYEFDTAVNPNSLNAESTIWFRDTFCMVPGNEHGVCWLDRVPDPYMQKTATGYRHVGTTETEVGPIRFQAFGTDCDLFSCYLDLKYTTVSYPGEYHQWGWLNSNKHRERRFRIDASPVSNKLNTRCHLAVTWSSKSGGTTTPPVCIGPGGACVVDTCCNGNRCVKAYNNTYTCQPNPTGATNDCNWDGEACCGPSPYVAADAYCNATWDPTLACSVGKCESGRR